MASKGSFQPKPFSDSPVFHNTKVNGMVFAFSGARCHTLEQTLTKAPSSFISSAVSICAEHPVVDLASCWQVKV